MPSLIQIAAAIGPRKALRIARQHIKQAATTLHPWYDTTDTCPDRAIIIGGCGRSGTTLARVILNRHPNIACGRETAILCDLVNPARLSVEWGIPEAEIQAMVDASPNIIRFCEAFFRSYAQREGKPRWADKTPRNVHAVPRILAAFPNAVFVHVVRDGRDVACSLRNHPKKDIRNGKVVPVHNDRPIRQCANRWLNDTSLGLAFRGHPRCFELRYERLVTDTENAVRELCGFIREDYSPQLLVPSGAEAAKNNPDADTQIKPTAMARWKRDLSAEERRTFVRIAGELLIATGYVKDHAWADEPVVARG